MLKALIVDDEKLVRKELRRLVDWSEYQIEIVGEAENGRAAMNLLSEHEVDLMISDLIMPGLSGMEFLQAVREKYPRVRIVVMTMHKDFDFIQQAMRLGAVDYITKTQIEKENFGILLQNILKRLVSVPGEECLAAGEIQLLYCPDPVAFPGDSGGFRKLDEGVYQIMAAQTRTPQGAIRLKVTDTYGMSVRQLLGRIREYAATCLFYEYQPGKQCYALPAREENPPALKQRDEEAARLKGADWLLDDLLFRNIMKGIPGLRMTRDELTVFFYQPYLTCAAYLHQGLDVYFGETGRFLWWHQWQEWLGQLRQRAAVCICPEDSPLYAIQKVIAFVDRHYAEDITLGQVLRLASMSKSSFSGLFKKQTGKTFVNYLKEYRVEKACKILMETEQPISRVGELVGYPDERYFRRVFLECTGRSPVHYRKKSKTDINAC